MTEAERRYIAALQEHAADTRTLFSNAQKAERERMVVRAFLRCTGIEFTEDEIRVGAEEPVDVTFRSARFQIMDIVGERKRGLVWKERQQLYGAAEGIADVMEPWTDSEPLSLDEVSRIIAEGLTKKAMHYGAQNCSTVDALVYIDLGGRHLWPLQPPMDATVAGELRRQSWRSVSMLFVPYGVVLATTPDAPDLLKAAEGLVQNKWSAPYGFFDP